MIRPDRKRFARLARDARGATAVEYGFILALIVLAAMSALTFMSGRVNGMWNMVSDKVNNAS